MLRYNMDHCSIIDYWEEEINGNNYCSNCYFLWVDGVMCKIVGGLWIQWICNTINLTNLISSQILFSYWLKSCIDLILCYIQGWYWLCSCLVFVGLPPVSSRQFIFYTPEVSSDMETCWDHMILLRCTQLLWELLGCHLTNWPYFWGVQKVSS